MVTRRVIAVAAILVIVPLAAHAQNVGVIDQMVQQFKNATNGWNGALQQIAQGTFGILALIQFGWAMIRLALRRADFSEFTAEIVNQIVFLGLFYWLLTTTTTWGPAIINSFRQAAGAAGGSAVLTPGDVFASGVKIAGTILSQMSAWSPAASVGLMIAGLVVMASFAYICATMVIALVRSYFIIGASVLFMAFGGSQWTSDVAISVVRTTLGIGAGLFALQLIVSIAMTFIQQWVSQFNDVTANSLMIEIGQALVLAVIAKIIPEDISRMVGGASFSHGGALFGAAAGVATASAIVGSGTARAAAGIAGAGAAVGSAARLATAQVAARGGTSSAMGRAATLTGLTARNAASAAGRDIGRRLSGQTMARGITGFRMAADLSQRAEQLQPPPPQNRRS
jgi:type IV secretion system protein TrbL